MLFLLSGIILNFDYTGGKALQLFIYFEASITYKHFSPIENFCKRGGKKKKKGMGCDSKSIGGVGGEGGRPQFLTNGPTTVEYCNFHASTALLQLIKGLSLDYQFAPKEDQMFVNN